MPWPLAQDYNEAIQSPATSFSDTELRQGEAVTNTVGKRASDYTICKSVGHLEERRCVRNGGN